LIKAVLS